MSGSRQRSSHGPPSTAHIAIAACAIAASIVLASEFSELHADARADTMNVEVEAADRFADGIASVNAPVCNSGNALGPTQTAGSKAELAYLSAYRFRHVRDGYSTCYHQKQFDDVWRALAAKGAKLLVTERFSYTDDDLRDARERNSAIEAISPGNEWDVENVDEVLGRDASPGDKTIVTRPGGLGLHMVAGQSYTIAGDQPESFTLVKPATHESGEIAGSLRYAHPTGSKITRDGDFVSDVDDWFSYYAPRLRRFQPDFPLLGASLAFPIHAEAFSKPTDRTDGKYGLNAVEEHGYPAPMGSNPEGDGGDGKRSYIAIDHPPCSFGKTSYSIQFNSCEASRQTGRPELPIWETEYSYQVVSNGGGPLPGATHPIPDHTSILYLARSEFFAAAHGRSRLYWFQMLDGTSGPKSGFCSYGLIYTGLCGEEKPVSEPRPKGELLTLGNLIAFFHDPACSYPACSYRPHDIDVRWSDPSAPLNTSAFGWKSGKLALVAWLGAKSYDFASAADCVQTSACEVNVAPRAERLTSSALHRARFVKSQTFDTNPSDPTPPETQVTSPDGSTQRIVRCPTDPKQNFYGCLSPVKTIPVSRGSFALTVSDDPLIVTFDAR